MKITEDQYNQARLDLDRAQAIVTAYHREASYDFAARWERWKKGEAFTDADLVYAAVARCSGCGAGMAYPQKCGVGHQWDCSAVLTHRVNTNVGHEVCPFMMYEIKSENQPSAKGSTTRPVLVVAAENACGEARPSPSALTH